MTQQMEALAKGNERRLAAAQLRREIAALSLQEGMRKAADLLENPDEVVGSLKVDWLLRAIRYVGEGRVTRLCNASLASSARRARRVRDLSARERGVLAANLRISARHYRGKKGNPLASSTSTSIGCDSEVKRGQDPSKVAA